MTAFQDKQLDRIAAALEKIAKVAEYTLDRLKREEEEEKKAQSGD